MYKLSLTLTLVAFSSGVLCNVVPNLTDAVNSTLGYLNQTEVRNSRVIRAVIGLGPKICKDCASHFQREDYRFTAGNWAYKLHTRMVNWYEARRSCVAEGSQLVIINSQEEATMLKRWLNIERVNSTWLGVHDLFQEGEWVTLTGEMLEVAGYDRWQDGEPNNLGFLRGEHCGHLSKFADGMNDEDCYITSPYFCKIYKC